MLIPGCLGKLVAATVYVHDGKDTLSASTIASFWRSMKPAHAGFFVLWASLLWMLAVLPAFTALAV
jgi:hypothetical protein